MQYLCYSDVSRVSMSGRSSSTTLEATLPMKGPQNVYISCLTRKKSQADELLYNPLLAYGRQIFQLCVGAVLFGEYLGAHTRLRDKLITNRERFELICKTLDDEGLAGRSFCGD